ncbi:hypothetical protein HDU98_008682 [Podochytrium sp. JEL0797]|nr:hypothetical protein HDU98_008682 [Podochytrium sp. JEL0797]
MLIKLLLAIAPLLFTAVTTEAALARRGGGAPEPKEALPEFKFRACDQQAVESFVVLTPALINYDASKPGQTFTVQLGSAPANGEVKVSLNAHGFRFDQNQVTFTTANWNQPQQVVLVANAALIDAGTSAVKLVYAIDAPCLPNFHQCSSNNFINHNSGKILTCSVTGDPHMKTFDGSEISYQGVGGFYYVKSKYLEVQGYQYPCSRGSSVACVGAVSVRYGDSVLMISGMKIAEDGIFNKQGASLTILSPHLHGMQYFPNDVTTAKTFTLTLDDGSVITIGWNSLPYMSVDISLAPFYRTIASGQCLQSGSGDHFGDPMPIENQNYHMQNAYKPGPYPLSQFWGPEVFKEVVYGLEFGRDTDFTSTCAAVPAAPVTPPTPPTLPPTFNPGDHCVILPAGGCVVPPAPPAPAVVPPVVVLPPPSQAGGPCGANGNTCVANLVCTANTCQAPPPSPAGGACGANGNTCAANLVCTANTCQAPLPSPAGGVCGTNGNTCAAGLQCNQGVCQIPPSVIGGPCGANGNTCATGLVCTNSICQDSPHNQGNPCGANGLCAAGLVCTANTCQVPPPSAINGPCGANGNTCAAGLVCSTALTCQPTPSAINGPCGANGNTCAVNLVCINSACQTPPPSAINGPCGTNGNTCAINLVCTANTCQTPPPSTAGGPCGANGNTCAANLACTNLICTPPPSVNGGQCGANAFTCAAGFVCGANGTCAPSPSAINGPCGSSGNTCATGLTCSAAGTCQVPPPSAVGGPCGTNGNTCAATLTCTQNVCVPPPSVAGGPCGSNGNTCAVNLVCTAGLCQAPPASGAGGPCGTNGNTCANGFVCTGAAQAGAAGTCAVPPAPVNGINGACGPVGGVGAPTCQPGLNCMIPANSPAGTAGTCQLTQSPVGGPCQQPIQNSPICQTNLVCVGASATNGGTCQQPAPIAANPSATSAAASAPSSAPVTAPAGNAINGTCGPLGAAGAPTCQSGLTCVIPANSPAGTTGTCQITQSPANGPCQQPIQFSPVCQAGLVCVGASAAVGGTCQQPAPAASATAAAATSVIGANAAPTGAAVASAPGSAAIGGTCGGNGVSCPNNALCIIPTNSPVGTTAGTCQQILGNGNSNPNAPLSDVNGSCGNGSVCRAGLLCIPPANNAAGAAGTCQAEPSTAVIGGPCGGNGIGCPTGAFCILSTAGTNIGTCQQVFDNVNTNPSATVSPVNGPCGQGSICQAGLVCSLSTCQLQQNPAGGSCGQAILNAPVCQVGLACIPSTSGLPGAAGVCQPATLPVPISRPPAPVYSADSIAQAIAQCTQVINQEAGCVDLTDDRIQFIINACAKDVMATGTHDFTEGHRMSWNIHCATTAAMIINSPVIITNSTLAAAAVQVSNGFGANACLNNCSGKGTCGSAGCSCNVGSSGNDCSLDLLAMVVPPPAQGAAVAPVPLSSNPIVQSGQNQFPMIAVVSQPDDPVTYPAGTIINGVVISESSPIAAAGTSSAAGVASSASTSSGATSSGSVSGSTSSGSATSGPASSGAAGTSSGSAAPAAPAAAPAAAASHAQGVPASGGNSQIFASAAATTGYGFFVFTLCLLL